MKVFQLKLFGFYNKSALLKTIILPIILLFCLSNLSAQKEPNIKLKIEGGVNWKLNQRDVNLWGLLLSLEPKVKTSKNTFIGLRIQTTENDQSNEKYKPPQFFIDNNISTNIYRTNDTHISFVPNIDYYFIENSFRTYLGVGVGYYMLTLPTKFSQTSPSGLDEASTDNKVVFLIRGGLEVGKISGGLEFNYIPKADIKIPNGLIIGTVNNSFIALTIGYTIGIGKGLK